MKHLVQRTVAGLILGLFAFPTAASALKPIAGRAPHAGYLDGLSVGRPMAYEGLTVYPLTSKKQFPLSGYLTLDEALKRKALIVTELGEGAEVNTLQVENRGDRHVFVMAGEILKGAKQDRTVQADLLLPPHSGKKRISAFCVEHGRWVEESKSFSAAEQAVPNSVRRSAKGEKQQAKVWDSIAQNQSRLKAAAPSGAAREVYENKEVQKDLKPLEQRLKGLPAQTADTVGVLAAFGDRLVALDVFGDTSLMSRLYPKLLRSYAIDVINDQAKGTMTADEARALIQQAAGAPWTAHASEGVGIALEFRLKQHHGSALLYKDMVVHTDQFEAVATPTSREPEMQRNQINPPNLDIRQQRR